MADRSRDTDHQIIRELRRDARQSNVALAKKVGLTEGAIRRRVENLVNSGAIRFTVATDPNFLGLTAHALLRVRCAPHLVDEVIAEMQTAPELERIYLCTGTFDLTAVGHFESTEALRDFRVNRVGTIAGVVEIQSEIVLQTVETVDEPAAPADSHVDEASDGLPAGSSGGSR